MRPSSVLLIECSVFTFVTLVSFCLRMGSPFALTGDGVFIYGALSFVSSCVFFHLLGTCNGVGRYVSRNDVHTLGAACLISVVAVWIASFLINRADDVPRSVPILQFALSFGTLLTMRLLAEKLHVHKTKRVSTAEETTHHVLLVGVNEVSQLYMQFVRSFRKNGTSIVGVLDEDASLTGRFFGDTRVLGRPQDLASILNRLTVHGVHVDQLVLAMPRKKLSETALDAIRDQSSNVRQITSLFESGLESWFELTPMPSGHASGPALPARATRLQHAFYLNTVKRSIDLAGATVLFLATLPVMLTIALLVALDVGNPILFWQVRPGRNGKSFRVFKFRTMRDGHDKHGNRIPDDHRSSVLGKLLRKLRLDELPQLFNILRGDMSFIGPRPLLPVDQPCDPSVRLSVRPGLTGWAQVHGGRSLSPEVKAALDEWYVHNASLGLDIRIIFKTVHFIIVGDKKPAPQAEPVINT